MVRLAWSALVAGLLSAAAAGSMAAPLHLCVDERPHPPYVLPDGAGSAQVLVRLAAARVGLAVDFHHAPLVRCIEEMRRGQAQGYPAAGFVDSAQDVCVFPTRGGRVDARYATAAAHIIAYQRVGGKANWDGQHLRGVGGKVLIARGGLMVMARLRAAGIEFDDGGRDIDANFAKLLAGRGDLALGFEGEGRVLLARAPYAGKLEALAVPFLEENYFLCLSHQFHDADPARAQALWDAIPKAAASAEYQAAIKGIK
jgi:hypothetical protein